MDEQEDSHLHDRTMTRGLSGNIWIMNDISPLMLQLLEWISCRPRSYAETMDAWRSTCPRLTIWEDALISGLVQVENGDSAQDSRVSLTAFGRSALDTASCQRKGAISS